MAVKAPGYGDRKKEILQDIAVVLGAQVVSDELGLKLDTVDLSVLGRASKVVSTKDGTVIVGGKGNKSDIDKRIAQLKKQKDSADRSCGVPQTVDQRQKDHDDSSTLYHNLSAAHQTVHAVRCMPSAVFDPATTPLFP